MNNRFLKGRNDNTVFVTEMCTNNCIMCCQPPKQNNDFYDLYKINSEIIKRSDTDVDYITITGGEPTLIGSMLYEYIELINDRMPNAHIHILTNGRMFDNEKYLADFCNRTKNKNISVGVPLHSDNYLDHNQIAGNNRAFFETVKGIQKLGMLGYNIGIVAN